MPVPAVVQEPELAVEPELVPVLAQLPELAVELELPLLLEQVLLP